MKYTDEQEGMGEIGQDSRKRGRNLGNWVGLQVVFGEADFG